MKKLTNGGMDISAGINKIKVRREVAGGVRRRRRNRKNGFRCRVTGTGNSAEAITLFVLKKTLFPMISLFHMVLHFTLL